MRGTRKDWTPTTREEIEAIVRAFLDAPTRESKRGGFAEVPEKDKGELDGLILALVKYRYEPDPDGDRPIRWSLCDWTREQPNSFVCLPYARDKDSEDTLDERLNLALLNLALSHEQVQQVQRERQFRKVPK